jgi:hypothetical protein
LDILPEFWGILPEFFQSFCGVFPDRAAFFRIPTQYSQVINKTDIVNSPCGVLSFENFHFSGGAGVKFIL